VRVHGHAGSSCGNAGVKAELHRRRGQNRPKRRRPCLLADRSPPALLSQAIDISLPVECQRWGICEQSLRVARSLSASVPGLT